jgi:autotransporter adhesin
MTASEILEGIATAGTLGEPAIAAIGGPVAGEVDQVIAALCGLAGRLIARLGAANAKVVIDAMRDSVGDFDDADSHLAKFLADHTKAGT